MKKRDKDKEAKRTKKSAWFRYMCSLSYNLQSDLRNNKLTMASFHWLDDTIGATAIKLFVKHLNDDDIEAMKRFICKNSKHFHELYAIADKNEKLKAKLLKLGTLL